MRKGGGGKHMSRPQRFRYWTDRELLQVLPEEEWDTHLGAVAMRMRDKKVPVRKETAKELMAVYRYATPSGVGFRGRYTQVPPLRRQVPLSLECHAEWGAKWKALF